MKSQNASAGLTHLRPADTAQRVVTSRKIECNGETTATATVCPTGEVLLLLKSDGLPKGDALALARVAGIVAGKKTSDVMPMCHSLPITEVTVDFALLPEAVKLVANVKTVA